MGREKIGLSVAGPPLQGEDILMFSTTTSEHDERVRHMLTRILEQKKKQKEEGASFHLGRRTILNIALQLVEESCERIIEMERAAVAEEQAKAGTMAVKCEEEKPLETLAEVATAVIKSEEEVVKEEVVKEEVVKEEGKEEGKEGKEEEEGEKEESEAPTTEEKVDGFDRDLSILQMMREKANVLNMSAKAMDNYLMDSSEDFTEGRSCLDLHGPRDDEEPLQYFPHSPPCDKKTMEHVKYLFEWGRAYGSMPFGIKSAISLALPEEDDHDFLDLKDAVCGHVNNIRFLHVVAPQLFMAMEHEWIFGDGGPDFDHGFFSYLASFCEYMINSLDLFRHQAEGVLCCNKSLLECVHNLHKCWMAQRVFKYSRKVEKGSKKEEVLGVLKPLALRAGVTAERRWRENYFYVNLSRNKNLTSRGVLVSH